MPLPAPRWTCAASLSLALLVPTPFAHGAWAHQPSPQLSVTVWKREVALQEPVLVRLQVRNPAQEPVRILPPYLDIWNVADVPWPLQFTITSPEGERVHNHWKYGKTGFEPVAYGLPWWGRPLARSARQRVTGAWQIPAQEAAFMWINLLQFYPLDEPGRYHISFRYDARPGMLARAGSDDAPDVWLGRLEADAGWITISQPAPPDREAAAFLREYRDRRGVVLSAGFRDDYALKPQVLERFPDSVYAPYAAFYQILWRAEMVMSRRRKGVEPSAAQFREQHPDFPLNYQLPVAEAFGPWRRVTMRIRRYPRPETVPPDSIDFARELADALQQATVDTGDYELADKVQNAIWLFETMR